MHLLGNTSNSSWRLLVTKYLQPFPYSANLLLLQLSTLTCQDFHQIESWIFTHPFMELLVHLHFDLQKRRFLLLIRFFISLMVAFILGFLIFSDNFFTSAKFLGSGMKWGILSQILPKLSIPAKSLLQLY